MLFLYFMRFMRWDGLLGAYSGGVALRKETCSVKFEVLTAVRSELCHLVL